MISVIIPVYNVELYLSACIKSVIGQTYKDLQILLIDDGSTDRSGAICDTFAGIDSRIKTVHAENKGVSGARNIGIKIAEGEWISFVDSDDILHPEMFSRLIETAERSGADLCKCGYAHIHSENAEKEFLTRPAIRDNEIEIVYSPDYLEQILNNYKSNVVWRSIFRTEAVKKCEYDDGYICEDILYQVWISPYIKKAAYISDYLYGYRQRTGSITKTENLPYIRRRMSAYELRNRYVASLFPDFIGMSKAGMMTMLVDCHIIAEGWDMQSQKEFADISRNIRKRNKLTLRELADNRIPARRRALVFIAMISMPIACKVKKRLRR